MKQKNSFLRVLDKAENKIQVMSEHINDVRSLPVFCFLLYPALLGMNSFVSSAISPSE